MAYAAAITLKQAIHGLLNSSCISIDSSSQEILDIAYKQLTSLQEVLKKSDERHSSKILDTLEGEIRESLHKLQDSLESRASEKILASHEEEEEEEEEEASSLILPLELDLKELRHEFDSFAEEVKKMEEKYIQELEKPFSNDDASPSQTIDLDHVKMIGLSDAFVTVKDESTRVIRPFEFGFFSFFGSAGSGRSILAKSVYEDIHVNKEGSFDCGAWVTIGSAYNLKRILLCIIYQINGIENLESLLSEGEEELGKHLYKSLEGKRYIISLDDIRSTEILIQLRRSFPEQNDGSLVFVTTGLIEVAEFDESFFAYTLPTMLDEQYVWKYIRMMFFGENEAFSPEFEEIVRKIAKNCRGNRLVVARIICILRGMKKLPENWGALAAEEHNRVYEVYDEISEANDVKKNLRDDDQVWAKEMFDVSILKDRIIENLYPDRLFPKMGIMTIYGMAGVGKTILMKKLFQDPAVLRRFDHRAWVNVGLRYNSEDIVVDILAQIYPRIDKKAMKEDAKLVEDLCMQLSCKKCFIVLDDLWSQEQVHFLKMFLPNIKGQLMITSRLNIKVGLFGPCDRHLKLRLMNLEESWDLLRENVFGEEICPFPLEKQGKKIAENCEGLPTLILSVAEELSKSEKTLEYWKMVATGVMPIVKDAQIKVSEALVPSYESLPQYLKACFLYMGIFPRKHEISTSKLMKLWIAEGFLEPNPSQTLEEVASRFLKELVDSNMVMVNKGSDLETSKTCYLHSVSWHLSNIEATKSKFFHTLKPLSNGDTLMEFNRQWRLCIRHSFLLGIENDVVAAFSSIRSLLCTGPPHQYPVPLFYGSKLLRVLEALDIRFYEFPVEAVRLFQLRYLALTCDGNLPPSISKLWNLQFLIVRQRLSIKSSSNSSYLPKEIWDLKELKHLHVSGSNLLDPENEALLPNLSSLLDVTVHSCTVRVFKGIPNLKKLGIQIELAPDDNSNPLHYLDHISHLSKLESLKCVIVNPDLGLEGVGPPNPRSMFPSSLKKLSLSGLGYSWAYMSIIGKLQNLEVLKLRCYAFVGPSWEMDDNEFSKLKSLSIEDTNLVRWDLGRAMTYNLQFVSFKHCYYLEQLPSYLPDCVKVIEVVESHPSSENWAKQMKENNWERRMENREYCVWSSWNDLRS